ncbi:hypothetical protein NPX13_g10438 [Xylaria arbuscula]|uniref:Helicase C-terminal domain-containing protein n=1 Tax=Xylaria arbuscula TaxID=114810 RepID=A0A9W8N4L1_9PEZI|nr:hypothetical protein NPX13_g10438 [Xylaria arbuscula]
MEVDIAECGTFPRAYIDDIRKLIDLSKKQLDSTLEHKINAWEKANPSKRGSLPTIETVISEMSKGFGGRFYDLGLCATFPALAPMLLSKKLSTFRSDDITDNLNKMSDEDLKNHTFWPHIDTIRNSSQKMDFIIQKIQDMLNDKERHQDVPETRPVLRKKMIILTIAPMIGYLIALVLRKEFPKTRQTVVLANEPITKREALYKPFSRMTDEEVSEDRNTEDPLILITTARISGEGFNFTRANYVVMVEPAFAKQIEDQAFHRVHRQGQQATTHLFSLYSLWNPAEVIVRSRQDTRSKLLLDESVWQVPEADA